MIKELPEGVKVILSQGIEYELLRVDPGIEVSFDLNRYRDFISATFGERTTPITLNLEDN
jgi:hypothetical protein